MAPVGATPREGTAGSLGRTARRRPLGRTATTVESQKTKKAGFLFRNPASVKDALAWTPSDWLPEVKDRSAFPSRTYACLRRRVSTLNGIGDLELVSRRASKMKRAS
jgi:hypothetical protein